MTCFAFLQIVDELREQILKLRFPHRVQNKEATPKTKRKVVGHPSPSKSPSIPAPKPALSDRPCVVVLNKPLEKLLIRSAPQTLYQIVLLSSWISYQNLLLLTRKYTDKKYTSVVCLFTRDCIETKVSSPSCIKCHNILLF